MEKKIENSVNKYIEYQQQIFDDIQIKIRKELEKEENFEIRKQVMEYVINSGDDVSLEETINYVDFSKAKNSEHLKETFQTYSATLNSITTIQLLLNNKFDNQLHTNFICSQSLMINAIRFPIADAFNLIMFVFSLDLDKLLNDEEGCNINYQNVMSWNFKYTSADEILYLIMNQKLDEFLKKKCSGEELLKQKEIKNYMDSNTIKKSDILEAQNHIKKHYLDKDGNIDEDDIEIIVNALSKALIETSLIEAFKNFLNKKIKKEEPEIKVNYNKAQNEYKEKEEEKEKLREELSNYIDLKTMHPAHTLSVDEVNRVLDILKFLKYDRDSIKEFLIKSELNLSSMDTISKYKYLKGRFEYYKEKYGLVQEVKDLDDYYNEFEDSTNDSDKRFYKNCLKDEMEFILKIIPSTFEYELRGV